MSKFITLKSIAFRWRHFKVNICCVHHQPVTQNGPVSAQTRSIDEYGLAEFSPFLLKSMLQFLQSLRRWLTTAHASIQVIHKCSIEFKSSDLNGQGALLRSGWLVSQQQHELCAAECCHAEKLPYGGSFRASICGVKTSSLYRAALRLPWMCTSCVFRRRISSHHHTPNFSYSQCV